jgi:hypothetical protein
MASPVKENKTPLMDWLTEHLREDHERLSEQTLDMRSYYYSKIHELGRQVEVLTEEVKVKDEQLRGLLATGQKTMMLVKRQNSVNDALMKQVDSLTETLEEMCDAADQLSKGRTTASKYPRIA